MLMKRSQNSAGYSMAEILAVMALLAIVAYIAVPSLIGRSSAHRQDHAVSLLLAGLESAKMQAISQDLGVEVLFDGANNLFCSEADLNGNGLIEANEINTLQLKGINDVTIIMPASVGKFTPQGQFSSTDTRWLITVQSTDTATQYIYVFPSGHIRQTDTIL